MIQQFILFWVVVLGLARSTAGSQAGDRGKGPPAFVPRQPQRGGSTSAISTTSSTTTIDPAIDHTESQEKKNATAVETRSIPEWKQKLPQKLQNKGKNLQRLILGDVEIYLLGTAHVCNRSSDDARILLETLQPECIFVELCEARIPLLEGEDENTVEEQSNSTGLFGKLRSIQEAQGGSRMQALSTYLLTSVQEDYAKELDVELGGEFRAAYNHWSQRSPHHPFLILGDRPLHLTLYRAWESLWWFAKIKVILGLLWSCLKKPNPQEIREWIESVLAEGSDVLTESLNDLRKHFPTLHTTIIAERDAWLAAKLTQTCRALQGGSCRVVAIVGAGHVPGIVNWLTNSTSAESPESILLRLSQTRRWKNDPIVQNEAIPRWVNEVSQLQDV